MGIKEKIENNVIIILFGSVVAASAVVGGVMTWFDEQKEEISKSKYEAKFDELTARISSVERRIGGEKYLDVRSLFDNKTATVQAGTPVRYFPDGHFSALYSVPGLTYEQTTEGKLLAEFLGKETDDPIFNILGVLKADVWRGERMKIGSDLYKNIFPVIMVEHLGHDDMGKLARGLAKAVESRDSIENIKPSKNANEIDMGTAKESQKSNDVQSPSLADDDKELEDKEKKFVNFFDRTFDADASGALVSGFLDFATAINSQDSIRESVSIRNIQKVGPVAYVQMIITLNDVSVNDVKYDRYFIIRELFIISSHNDLNVVATTIPTDNPFAPGQTAAAINEWLASFHLED
jgi:hypothetical protein